MSFTTPGTEDSACAHMTDQVDGGGSDGGGSGCCDETNKEICGPDITESLLKLMEFVHSPETEGADWFSAFEPFSGSSSFDLKQYSKPDPDTGKPTNIKTEAECPVNCPPKDCAEDTPGKEFGCVTLCDMCVEGSVPGNILFRYFMNSKAGEAGNMVADIISFYARNPPKDQCAEIMGRCVATKAGKANRRHKPEREDLCNCIEQMISVGCDIQTCRCDPCEDENGKPGKGEYPGFGTENQTITAPFYGTLSGSAWSSEAKRIVREPRD